jgi:hypothetical protein
VVTFFLALRPFPAYGLAALAAATLFGVATVAWSPGELDSALGLVLFVQLFLASTGFVVTAHRGHFDPMLGHGRNRILALAAQWAVSIAPGMLAWAVIVSTALAMGSAMAWSAVAGTRAAAFFIVSSVSWSAGFALPRGGAGVIWTAGLIWLLLRHAELLIWAGSDTTTLGLLRTAAVLVVCPFLLMGSHAQPGVFPVAAAFAFALVVLLVTWRSGSRLDVYLAERS